jgi:hypothetical protein
MLTPTNIQIRPVENQFLAVDPRRLPEIPDQIVKMMGYGLQKPFIGYSKYTPTFYVVYVVTETGYS